MRALLLAALTTFGIGSATGRAHADPFATAAAGAVPITHVDELVWSLVAPCDHGDDVEQRQCRVVRDRAAAEHAGQTLLVAGDADAFELGKWDAARKSVPLALTPCVRCRGVEVDGRAYFAVGLAAGTASGAPKFEGGALRPAPLYSNARRFSDEAAATAWAKTLKGVRVDLLVKAPGRKWQAGGKLGVSLDLVGYRVVSPCDGSIVIAAPEAAALPPDKAACAAPSILDERTNGEVPDALTDAVIETAMKPVFAAAHACHEHYGMAGKATIEVTVSDDGTVSRYQQQGDFTGTPTGVCIDTAIKAVRFPRTKRPQSTFSLPITLP